MTLPVTDKLQGGIRQQLAEDLVRNTKVCFNLGGTIISTTEDKVRLAVHSHLARMQLKYSWITPLGILLSLGLALVTADFKDAWLPAATWKAFYLIIGAIMLGWLACVLWRAIKAPTVEEFVSLLRASQVPLSDEPAEQDRISTLICSEWILFFNPPTGTKTITFRSNGLIGEGRNKNESSWRINGNQLEILNTEGKVFSRFIYNEKLKQWSHTNDPDTLSLRDQYIKWIKLQF